MPARIFNKWTVLFAFCVLSFWCGWISPVQAALVDINTAGSAELETLNGIGPAYAQRIIDYRNTHGPFENIEDIKKVSGIGEVTFSKIKDQITVGNTSGSEGNNLGQEGSATTTATITGQTTTGITSSQSSSNTVTVSTHYSATPLTSLKPDTKFTVGAGRDRLGSVGSPLEFKVETNYGYTRNSIFKWNFGDGSERVGDVLNHTYEYPGEYIVVLNVSLPEGQAVSRVNVKIVEPEIIVTLATPERIEIKNNSKYEVSLFGRALVAGRKIFAFPQDTILKAGQSISFGRYITGLDPFGPSDISVVIVGTEIKPQEVLVKIEEEKLGKIAGLRNEIDVLEKRRLALSQKEVSDSAVEAESQEVEQTALVLNSVPQAKSSRIKGWLETLKRFFFRTR